MSLTPNSTVIGYRMDVKGRIFSRSTDDREREITCSTAKIAVLTDHPEVALSLSNKG